MDRDIWREANFYESTIEIVWRTLGSARFLACSGSLLRCPVDLHSRYCINPMSWAWLSFALLSSAHRLTLCCSTVPQPSAAAQRPEKLSTHLKSATEVDLARMRRQPFSTCRTSTRPEDSHESSSSSLPSFNDRFRRGDRGQWESFSSSGYSADAILSHDLMDRGSLASISRSSLVLRFVSDVAYSIRRFSNICLVPMIKLTVPDKETSYTTMVWYNILA